jgi:hypothetical protein
MLRTPESYQKHLEKVARCSSSFSLYESITEMFDLVAVFPDTCGSNYCACCRKANLIKLRKTLYRSLGADKWRLCTLTFEQSHTDKLFLIRNLNKIFDRFMKRIRRTYPLIKFARSVEIHQSGYPHIHLIFNQYIPYANLQFHWKEVGGGYSDIHSHPRCKLHNQRRCEICFPNQRDMNYKDAARYLTEEFEKTVQDPHSLGLTWWLSGRRSFATSRNLSLRNPVTNFVYIKPLGSEEEVLNYLSTIYEDVPATKEGNSYFVGDGVRETIKKLNVAERWEICDKQNRLLN